VTDVISGTNVETYLMIAASVAASSCRAVNASMGPASTVAADSPS